VTYWEDADKLAQLSRGLGAAMPGLEIGDLAPSQRFADRGW